MTPNRFHHEHGMEQEAGQVFKIRRIGSVTY